MNKKFDWTKPTSEALLYYHRKKIPVGEIIDEVYENYRACNKSIELNEKEIVVEFMYKIKSVLQKITEDESQLEIFVQHAMPLTAAFLIYCVDQEKNKPYKNFYDFLAKYKTEYKND